MPDIPQYVLAIETATSKGSLSLLKDGIEIDHWAGGVENPLSAELLPQISRLLESAGITINEIGLLVVCSGPGSFTGVRIGLSTAKALQMAAGIKAAAVTLPHGMARYATMRANIRPDPFICIIPAGRDEFYWQEFGSGESSTRPKTAGIDEIVEFLLREKSLLCVGTQDIKVAHLEKIKENSGKTVNIVRENLATYLAEVALCEVRAGRQPGTPDLSPLYIKEFGE